MKGYIHSKESFGTVDGPGIRYVLFMQGCPMRCLYCHNPDTWQMQGGTEVTSEEILAEYKKNISFYSKGGITVTGGEPLMQTDFLIDLFRKAKAEGIHTCIDTSGITYSETGEAYTRKLDELMKYTDLVMLDIKHIDPERHKALTSHTNENILAFARYLERKNIPLWVRHVVVERYTDDPVYLHKLGRFIGTLRNLKALLYIFTAHSNFLRFIYNRNRTIHQLARTLRHRSIRFAQHIHLISRSFYADT